MPGSEPRRARREKAAWEKRKMCHVETEQEQMLPNREGTGLSRPRGQTGRLLCSPGTDGHVGQNTEPVTEGEGGGRHAAKRGRRACGRAGWRRDTAAANTPSLHDLREEPPGCRPPRCLSSPVLRRAHFRAAYGLSYLSRLRLNRYFGVTFPGLRRASETHLSAFLTTRTALRPLTWRVY